MMELSTYTGLLEHKLAKAVRLLEDWVYMSERHGIPSMFPVRGLLWETKRHIAVATPEPEEPAKG